VAVSGDWYSHLFGDTERFAVMLTFGRDPHPTGDVARDAGWGGLALWARGRCLTRNVSSDGSTSDQVRWNLLGILGWLAEVGPRLVNEEPFPLAPRRDRLGTATDWLDATELPFPTPTEAEETTWFEKRSDWRQHHSIRRAAQNVALPNISIRRLGDFLEISWDNETWGTSRRDLAFVERRGAELVTAAAAVRVLCDALRDAAAALGREYPATSPRSFAMAGSTGTDLDWKWLVHPDTARAIAAGLPALSGRLTSHTAQNREAWYVPHAPETLALRQTHLSAPEDIEAFLGKVRPPEQPVSEALRALAKPCAAPLTRPWVQGYEQAEAVREAFDLGDEPFDDLAAWLRENDVEVVEASLDGSIALVAARSGAMGAKSLVNPTAMSRVRREIGHAACLEHRPV
jgi:hypothetical protein